jgi:hypothetical protein
MGRCLLYMVPLEAARVGLRWRYSPNSGPPRGKSHMIPDELSEAIRTRLGDQSDPTLRTYGAAVAILKQHLGEPFIAAKVSLSSDRIRSYSMNLTKKPDRNFTYMGEYSDWAASNPQSAATSRRE